MSEIITNKLTGKTAAGNVTITSEGGSATMQLQQGVVKAWVNFNGRDTLAVQDSLNYSSVTDNQAGDYTSAYTNNFGNSNYTAVTSSFTEHNNGRGSFNLCIRIESDNSITLQSSSQVRTVAVYGASSTSNGGEYDPIPCYINHAGDLA
tara:strand:- start:57 stop:503 length:447 start_codon:yes stop_codon:yes gene_type:complete